MANRFHIVGLGEALFDIFPDRQVLGGAPLNVAVHAHQLAQVRGGSGIVLSRVGQDELGRQVAQELRQRGMSADYLQEDPDRETGKVYVSFDEKDQPSYEIVRDVAWDWLQFDPDAEDLAQRCDAVAFGTLGQREGQARSTIQRFVTTATRALRLFDVNLRPPFYDLPILRRSCELANAIKLNDQELPIVGRMLALPADGASSEAQQDRQATGLLKRFNLKMVVVTRGAQGTVIYHPGGKTTGQPISYPAATGSDTVGAGDACTAAILVGMTLRLPMQRIVDLANHAGAFVAAQPGATPTLPATILDMLK